MNNGLRHSGIPLGGLGTGSVELRGDGLFHEWQIMNNRPWGYGPPANLPADTFFFGLQVHGARENRTVALCTAPDRVRMLNNPYDMPWLEHAAAIDPEIRFPFTRLNYDLGDLPVTVEQEAFSPFIPLDSKNSGLPLAFFTFRLRNRSKRVLKTTLFGCLRNVVGYSQPDAPSSIDAHPRGSTPYLRFSREGLSKEQNDAGDLVLGMLPKGRGTTSYAAHFRPRDLWEPLRETGLLENRDLGAMEQDIGNMGDSQRVKFRQGLPMGVLARTITLQAGASTEITCVLAWHFPNMVERDYQAKDLPGTNIGHKYATWFDNAAAVFDYGAGKLESLRKESLAFVDAYYQSSMPTWLLDAIIAQMTTLPKASWWDREGRFGIWEGLGCCGLQTTDITHYGSFPIVQFFPDIQKSQMRLTRDNTEIQGKIPHMMPGNFSCCDVDHRGRIDLIPQFILLVWRDVLWTGDTDYLAEMWQAVKDALDFFKTTDTDGDGLPNNTGPDQTYDQFPLKGTSAFVGFLYLGALQATAEMAGWMDEPEFREELLATAKTAAGLLQKQLWNGRYYRLCHDPVTGKSNNGVMTDQLNADWFMRQTIGRGLVENQKAKSSLRSILEACSNPTGYLANCAWPKGGAVKIGRHTADQANWPWSGVEYAVAAHLILMGMEGEGLEVTRDVWDRYERHGLRFNHIECGGHYYRAMSSWAVYLALGGYQVDLLSNTLHVRLRKQTVRVVLATPTGWGVLETDRKARKAKLTLMRGSLKLKAIEVTGIRLNEITARVGRRKIKASSSGNSLELSRSLRMKQGESLTLTF